MDLNYFIHNVLLAGDENSIFEFAHKIYRIVTDGQDDFIELHPDDRECWIEVAEAAIQVLQQELISADVSSD